MIPSAVRLGRGKRVIEGNPMDGHHRNAPLEVSLGLFRKHFFPKNATQRHETASLRAHQSQSMECPPSVARDSNGFQVPRLVRAIRLWPIRLVTEQRLAMSKQVLIRKLLSTDCRPSVEPIYVGITIPRKLFHGDIRRGSEVAFNQKIMIHRRSINGLWREAHVTPFARADFGVTDRAAVPPVLLSALLRPFLLECCSGWAATSVGPG